MNKIVVICLLALTLACEGNTSKQHVLQIVSVRIIEDNKLINITVHSLTDDNLYSLYVNKGWGGSALLLTMSQADVGKYIIGTRNHHVIDGDSWGSLGFVPEEYIYKEIK